MGLFDKFKKKKAPTSTDVKSDDASVPTESVGNDSGTEAVKLERETVKIPVPAMPMPHGSRVLVRPWLSEKGTHFAANGKYVFLVERSTNKAEVRKTIQKLYNVHVEDVKIINMPAKKRRYGAAVGQTSPRKKAVVVLRSGEKIPGIIESVG